MNYHEQINEAIRAHDLWKSRLKKAIILGRSDFDLEIVKTDNNCNFGKWLHTGISKQFKNNDKYKTTLKNHAEFHIEAARVLKLALDGKKEEAENAISPSSKFASISALLKNAMVEWKNSLMLIEK